MLEYPKRNQLENLSNQYQGKQKRVLCVCSAGMLRSPTAANVLNREYGYNTRAVGLYDYALIPISLALLFWSDEILVMEQSHKTILFGLLQYSKLDDMEINNITKKIKVLNIPDDYNFMDKKLQVMILKKYKELIDSEV